MGDKNFTNNTDPEVNPDVEHTFGGGTFNFSSPSNPSENTSWSVLLVEFLSPITMGDVI